MDHDLPSRIKKARQELKLNQTEASVEWGMRLSTQASWENNRRRPCVSALPELNRILDSILGAPSGEPAGEPPPRAPEPFAETVLRHAEEGRRVIIPRRVCPPAADQAEFHRGTGVASSFSAADSTCRPVASLFMTAWMKARRHSSKHSFISPPAGIMRPSGWLLVRLR
ncbi:MAG: hypothetical protein JWM59_2437 [Verrucomicrobiales bacterium]|nr:hypothetical protein [Verrucomicrobiales bacterium]